MRQDTRPIACRVQITVGKALPGQLRAWTDLWSKLLAPVETEHSMIMDQAATAPEESGAASARKAEQAVVEVGEGSGGEGAHV
jgi:hypothetical protein